MSQAYNLWLEYPTDWRPLRDFFYEACKCTRFWTGPMTMQEGPPDEQERARYGVENDYNLIDLGPPLRVKKPAYTHDVNVCFTLNNPDRWAQWQNDVIDASVRWLARSTGDALLDWDLVPILGRKGAGPIIVSNETYDNPSPRELAAQRPEYQAFIAAALKREGLGFEFGPLDPIDLTPVPSDDEDGDD